MKVLYIWNAFQPELKYHVHYLAENLTREGHEVYFIASDKVNKAWQSFLKNSVFKPGREEYPYATVFRLHCFTVFDKEIPVNWWEYYRLIKRIAPDVVHVTGVGSFFSWVGLLLVKIWGNASIVIANDHTNPTSSRSGLIAGLYRRLNTFLFRIAGHNYSYVISPNIATQQYLRKLYRIPAERSKVIPLGYNGNLYRFIPEKKNAYRDLLVVSFAGKVEPRKNLQEMLLAVAGSKYKENILIRIAGVSNAYPDYLNTLKEIVSHHALKVDFLPLLQLQDLVDFYNFSDVALFPGSVSITTVEANGCGCPVLLFRSIDGLEDRVESGRGVLFSERSELITLVDSFYEKKMNGGINHSAIGEATRKYTWENIFAEYQKIYENA